jgi:hypothetical protein
MTDGEFDAQIRDNPLWILSHESSFDRLNNAQLDYCVKMCPGRVLITMSGRLTNTQFDDCVKKCRDYLFDYVPHIANRMSLYQKYWFKKHA